MNQRPYYENRNQWLEADHDTLLKACSLEGYQASGPGGQKRNRKFSAVRITHLYTKISVTSSETRSQHSNRKIAVKKLKQKIAVEIDGPKITFFNPTNIKISLLNSKYPLFVAYLFDNFSNNSFCIKETAESLEISSSKLIKLISRDIVIWKIINRHREKAGLKPLSFK